MKTQIYATFGPSCRTKEVLSAMVAEGLCGMRLNLSHMSLTDAKEYIDAYRGVTDSPQILIDMQGPELRVGDVDLMLCDNEVIDTELLRSPIELYKDDEILLDDGKILLSCVDCHRARVIRGGRLTSRKSIKLTNRDITLPALTDHDIANIRLAPEYSVTAVMQPFVRSADDLKYVRKVLDENGCSGVKIFAKIENRQGMARLEEIVGSADVIVIARGDLGNDMPLWELPRAQKQIEAVCKAHNKPYIVVTQMLASMENSPVPTRAEVSDIFHAVCHGAWGVMITGESAIGKYPVESVRYLNKTAETARNM